MNEESPFILKIAKTGKERFQLRMVREWLKREVIRNKLESPLGYMLFTLLAFGIGYFTPVGGVLTGTLLVAALVIIPSLAGAMFHPRFGLYLMVLLGFLVPFVKRLEPAVPMGITMDVTMLIMLLGLYIRESRYRIRQWTPLLQPLSIVMLVWILYCLVQGLFTFNGNLQLLVAGFRYVGGFVMLYFLGLYGIRRLSTLVRLVQVWLAMASVAMVYGYVQQIFGLGQWEMERLLEGGGNYDLLVIPGVFRKFSFFSDPATFGLTMAGSGLVTWILSHYPDLKNIAKWALRVLAVAMWFSGYFSGTRTVVLALIAAAGFHMLLAFRKDVFISSGILGIIMLGFIFLPVDTSFRDRYQTIFHPNESASFLARISNQQALQPLIQASPFGMGPGAINIWQESLSADSYLAQYPPESGYLILAGERGWVGLAIFLVLLWIVFFTGIKGYQNITHQGLRVYQEAFMTFVFFLACADFPQRGFSVMPLSILFFISAAALYRIPSIETADSQPLS